MCWPTQLVDPRAVGDIITIKEPVRNLQDIAKRGIMAGSNQLEGKKVIIANGYVVGEIQGIDVELSNWKVTGLQVGLTEDAETGLGFKRPFLTKVVVIIPRL